MNVVLPNKWKEQKRKKEIMSIQQIEGEKEKKNHGKENIQNNVVEKKANT